ncbi:hypothetical protein ACFONG_18905 [Uliginosibacterium paludis]|uniref:GAF domain-containing protein n=1 Tax=Uliginosibacterium paludis TaxID=1615952 RepID=A0ABV2CT21_9RHOO
MKTPDLHALHSLERTTRSCHYFTCEVAQLAVGLTEPMIEQALNDRGVVGSGFLYLVVMDPAKHAHDFRFEDAVLYERSFGDRTKWDADYAAFARAKARLSWCTGRDGHVVQCLMPHLLNEGDTLLSGGICLDGIVVAASGAFPLYDEVFATTVALWIRAIVRKWREEEPPARVSL